MDKENVYGNCTQVLQTWACRVVVRETILDPLRRFRTAFFSRFAVANDNGIASGTYRSAFEFASALYPNQFESLSLSLAREATPSHPES